MQEWERERERDKLRSLRIEDMQRRQQVANTASLKDDSKTFLILAGVAVAILFLPFYLLYVGFKWLFKGGWIKRFFSLFFIAAGTFGTGIILLFLVGVSGYKPSPQVKTVLTSVGAVANRVFHGASSGSANESAMAKAQQSVPTGHVVSTSNTIDNSGVRFMAAPTQVDATSENTPIVVRPEGHSREIVASFDCTRAASAIEHLICSTPESADADRRLASAYSAARSKTNVSAALRVEQRNWLSNVRNACSDTACLVRVTDARIQELSAF